MTRLHAIVVDDRPLDRRLAVALLEAEGFLVTTASSALGALEAVEAARPDVALLGFDLPDGAALTRWLTGSGPGRPVPVLCAGPRRREVARGAAPDGRAAAVLAKRPDARAVPRLLLALAAGRAIGDRGAGDA